MRCLMVSLFAAAVAFTLEVRNVAAQDLVKVAPNNCKVLLENDNVRVIDVWVKKGEKVAMHSHPNHILYFVSDGKMKTSFPDGKTSETDAKAGSAVWIAAVTHANENIGSADMHAIVIELKSTETKSEMKK